MSVHLLRELERLKQGLLELWAHAQQAVQEALWALEQRDAETAQRRAAADDELDRRELELREECLKVLALYQPVATDLRFVIAVMDLARDLERIGDLAEHISERVLRLVQRPPRCPAPDFNAMAAAALAMLNQSLDALLKADASAAREVIAADDRVDADRKRVERELVERIRQDPDCVTEALDYLAITRHLERIADHAVRTAEDVIYLLEGRWGRPAQRERPAQSG